MNKTLEWLPRVLAIIYAVFISIFALDGESFLGVLIHLIPSFVLVGIIILAWKKELYGGIVFVIFSIIFTIFFNTYREIISFLLISLPLLIIGGLFILNYFLRKK